MDDTNAMRDENELPDWAGPFTPEQNERMEMDAEHGAREDYIRELIAEHEDPFANYGEWLADEMDRQHEEAHWALLLERAEQMPVARRSVRS